MAWKDAAVRLIVLGFIVLLALGAFSAIGLGEEAGAGEAGPELMLAQARPASVEPDVTLSSGRYAVIDSDFATWSQNAESGDAGIARVEGRPR